MVRFFADGEVLRGDTVVLTGTLRRTAESSNGLSLSPPIEDRPGWPA